MSDYALWGVGLSFFIIDKINSLHINMKNWQNHVSGGDNGHFLSNYDEIIIGYVWIVHHIPFEKKTVGWRNAF